MHNLKVYPHNQSRYHQLPSSGLRGVKREITAWKMGGGESDLEFSATATKRLMKLCSLGNGIKPDQESTQNIWNSTQVKRE